MSCKFHKKVWSRSSTFKKSKGVVQQLNKSWSISNLKTLASSTHPTTLQVLSQSLVRFLGKNLCFWGQLNYPLGGFEVTLFHILDKLGNLLDNACLVQFPEFIQKGNGSDPILVTRPAILLHLAQIGKQVKWGLQNFSEQKKLNPTFPFILCLQAFQLMQCTSALVATDHCKSSRKATALYETFFSNSGFLKLCLALI